LLKAVPEDDPDTDDELEVVVRSSMRSDGAIAAFAAEAATGRERTPPRAVLPSLRDEVELPRCRAAAAFAAALRGYNEEDGPSAGAEPTSAGGGRAAATDEASSDAGTASPEELAEVAAYRALGQCFGPGMHALCKTVANDDWGPLLSRLAPSPPAGGGAGVGQRARDGRFRTSTSLPPPGARGMRLYGIHPEQNCAGLVWDARQLVSEAHQGVSSVKKKSFSVYIFLFFRVYNKLQ
jgi:hypothetical protein